MKKVLLVATVVRTHINVFHLPYIEMFKNNGYETVVAAKNDYEDGIPNIPNCDKYIDIPFARNPFNPKNITAYKMLKKLIDENDFDIIQCNTPVGGVLSRLAAIQARKRGTKVIYIAHGFHFFKGGSPFLWLTFYPIEKLLSYVTDILITINNEDYEIASKKFKAKRTVRINGIGADLKNIESCIPDKAKLRSQIGIKDSDIMLVSVGELIKRKNHKTIIKAIAKLNDPTVHYVIAGSGILRNELEAFVKSLGLEKNVHFLGFCNNVNEILKSSDIFCFASYQEGLPVALMEAMAAGLPAVVSSIRGNKELIVPDKGGFLYRPDDVDGFAQGIKALIKNPELRHNMGKYNIGHVEAYDLEHAKKALAKIYFPSE